MGEWNLGAARRTELAEDLAVGQILTISDEEENLYYEYPRGILPEFDEKHVFDVALSFSGEKRDYVTPIAEQLTRALGPDSCFYHRDSRAHLEEKRRV